MTTSEFLSALRDLDRPWAGDTRGYIMATDAVDCPLTAVCRELRWYNDDTDGLRQAARRLGLPLRAARRIMVASNNHAGLRPELRRRLLEACGLQEKWDEIRWNRCSTCGRVFSPAPRGWAECPDCARRGAMERGRR